MNNSLYAQMEKLSVMPSDSIADFTEGEIEFAGEEIKLSEKSKNFKRDNKPITEKMTEKVASDKKKEAEPPKPDFIQIGNNKSKKKKSFGKTPSMNKQMSSIVKSAEQEAKVRGEAQIKEKPKPVKTDNLPESKETCDAIYFNPKLIAVIREKLTERGIEISPLRDENVLPFVFLVKQPVSSYSSAFGKPCTFIVTHYYNNGRTERVELSLVDAPVVVSDTKKEVTDVSKLVNYAIESQGDRKTKFKLSIVLSADKDNEGDKTAEPIAVKEPFSIDGLFGGAYITDGNTKIFVRNPLPITVRENYPLFKKILSKEITEDNAGTFYRQSTREMNSRERVIFRKEMNAFSNMCPDIDDVFYTGGVISRFIEQ